MSAVSEERLRIPVSVILTPGVGLDAVRAARVLLDESAERVLGLAASRERGRALGSLPGRGGHTSLRHDSTETIFPASSGWIEFGDELDVFTAFCVCDDFFQLKRSLGEFDFC